MDLNAFTGKALRGTCVEGQTPVLAQVLVMAVRVVRYHSTGNGKNNW